MGLGSNHLVQQVLHNGSSLSEHWSWGQEYGIGELVWEPDVSSIGRDHPDLGSSLWDSLNDSGAIESHSNTSDEANAGILNGDDESVPDPRSWLFSPICDDIARRCEGTTMAAVNEVAEPYLDPGESLSWLPESPNLFLEALSQSAPSLTTNQSPTVPRPLTTTGWCETVTYVALLTCFSYV